MKQSKGLSQILYLIIAASVLMIAALSLIFMLDAGLPDGETQVQSCNQQLQTQCDLQGSGEVNVPSSCFLEDGVTPRDGANSNIAQGADTIDCSNVN